MPIDTAKASINYHTTNYVEHINQNLRKGFSYYVSLRTELYALYQYFEHRDLVILHLVTVMRGNNIFSLHYCLQIQVAVSSYYTPCF